MQPALITSQDTNITSWLENTLLYSKHRVYIIYKANIVDCVILKWNYCKIKKNKKEKMCVVNK